MSYADIVRQKIAAKHTSQRNQKRKTKLDINLEQFRKNQQISKECPFIRGVYYKVKELNTSDSYPFKLDGVFMFRQIHYDWERYIWSDGDDHLHGMTWSTTFNVDWKEATLDEVKQFYERDKDGSFDPTGTGKVKQYS